MFGARRKGRAKCGRRDGCRVNLLTNSMNVEGHADSGAIIAAVTEAGYGASLKEDGQGGQAQAKSGASEADQLASTQRKPFVLCATA